MVYKLGSIDYGIVALTTTITGFLGFLDLGFTGASVKYISESYAKKDYKKISDVVNLSLIIYIIMGIFAAIILILFINSPLLSIFKIQNDHIHNLEFAFYIGSINIIFNMILGVFSNIPYALQRNDIQARSNIILSTLTNLLMFIFLIAGYKIRTIMIIKLLSSIYGIVFYYFVDVKLLPDLHIKFFYDKLLFLEMLKFSIYNMVSQLNNILFTQFDRIIISSLIGVPHVTYYAVPDSLGSKVHQVIATITNVLFPLASELSVNNNIEKIKKLYKSALKTVFFLSNVIAIPCIVFSKNILTIWMGAEFADKSYNILQILLISYLILSSNTISYYIIFGLNKPKINAMYSLTCGISKIAFCFIFIPLFGLKGVAIAFLISMILTILYYLVYFEHLINIKKGFFIFKVYLPMFLSDLIAITLLRCINYSGTNIIVIALLSLLILFIISICSMIFRYFKLSEINKFVKSLLKKI